MLNYLCPSNCLHYQLTLLLTLRLVTVTFDLTPTLSYSSPLKPSFLCCKRNNLELIRTLFEPADMSQPVIVQAKETHTATVIFLHGLGDSGHGWASTIGSVVPSYVKVVCPTAPVQPVTLNGGYAMPSWFDLVTLEIEGAEDANSIKKAGELMTKFLDDEISKSGIKSNRILLGGFSQGGGLALHTGFRYSKPLAGLLGLSCWLPLHKEFPGAMNEANKDIAILQCHGQVDTIVPIKWGDMSASIIKTMTSKSEFKSYPGLAHSSSEEELRDMKEFIKRVLPAE
ncbi:Acyl-protein thioesterase 1 [Halotydeus destructor]|nr:Acyl-protein thioesterase 1 [Halotydeus destructor]